MKQSNLLSAFLSLTLLVAFIGCQGPVSENLSVRCSPIAGADPLLIPGKVILLGELHGTREAPYYTGLLACLALRKDMPVTVGLELPRSDQSAVDEFVNSEGSESDRQSILNLPFWARDYQDGRASQAMLELLDEVRILKNLGHPISVLLIDQPSASDRDLAMATRVIKLASQQTKNFVIVLTGNYHNMINKGSGKMGTYILADLGLERVVSLKQNHIGGSAWLDIAGVGLGPAVLRGTGNGGVGIRIDEFAGNYHGVFEMDSIHHSRPARELLAQ